MKAKLKIHNQNSKYLIIFALIFAVIGGAIILASKAATPSYGLYFNPSTSTAAVGSQISVGVYANLNSTSGINNITSYIKYDTTQLRLDLADQTGTPSYPVKSWCTVLEGCKPAGEIVFTEGYSGTGTIAATSTPVLVGNLKFTVLKTGTAALTFDTDPNLSGFISNGTASTSRTLENGAYTLVPTAPTALTSPSQTDGSISLSWAASNDGASGANLTGYKIFRNGTQIGTSTTATYTDSATALMPSTSYSYTVVGYDNAGNNSAASSALAVSTKADATAPTVPGKPTIGTVTGNSVALSWTASTDKVGVTGYKFYRNGALVTPSPAVTGTSWTDTGLATGTTYSYTVVAYDAVGNTSAQSVASSATTVADAAPTVPGSFAVAASTTKPATATLVWTTSTDDVGVTGYHVYRNGSATPITPANGVNALTFDDSGLTPGTYTYTVKAIDTKGQLSGATAAKSVTIYSAYDPSKDGIVGIADLNIVLSNYGKTGVGDVDGNGIVNIVDISALLTRWGTAG